MQRETRGVSLRSDLPTCALQETGILNRWRRRLRRTTYTGSRLCSTEATTSQYRQLGLGSVATIHVTLAAGLLLSLLLLAAEIVVFRVSRRRAWQQRKWATSQS